MFKESKPLSCEAIQVSDQMRCERCDLLWDINDPEPPKCKTGKELYLRTKTKLKRVNNND